MGWVPDADNGDCRKASETTTEVVPIGELDAPRIAECPTNAVMLAPLGLSTMSQYFLHSGRSDFPGTTFTQLEIEGRHRVDVLIDSLHLALRRHPLFAARVARGPCGGWNWVFGDVSVLVDTATWLVPLEFPRNEWIDLKSEPGLRLWIRTGPDRLRVTLQTHHACTDGSGKLRFVCDWLTIYDRKLRGETASLPFRELDAAQIREWLSADPRRENWTLWRAMVTPVVEALRMVPALMLKTVELGGAQSSTPPSSVDWLDSVSATLDSSRVEQLRRTAAQLDVTLNDMLLTAWFETALAWVEQQRTVGDRERFRIAVPFTLLDPTMDGLPANNSFDLWFLTRTARVIRDRQNLVNSIHREMDIPRSRSQYGLLRDLRVMNRVRGVLGWSVRRFRSRCTLAFTNLGDVTRRTERRLSNDCGCWATPTFRVSSFRSLVSHGVNIPVAIEAYGYAGAIELQVRTTSCALSPPEIRQFLDLFLKRLALDGWC